MNWDEQNWGNILICLSAIFYNADQNTDKQLKSSNGIKATLKFSEIFPFR